MRGLTIIVGSGSPARLEQAIALLAAQRALEGTATLFCTGDSVLSIATAMGLDEILEEGARVVVCQTSLDTQDVTADQLDPRIEAGGMVSLLQGLGDDRLIAF